MGGLRRGDIGLGLGGGTEGNDGLVAELGGCEVDMSGQGKEEEELGNRALKARSTKV